MKTIKLMVLGLLLSSGLFASEGQGTGNGGDHLAQDFVISARKGLDVLKRKSSYFPFIDIKAVEESIESAEVILLAKGEAFEGVIRTAENFPNLNIIKVNVDRWSQIKDPNRKMALSMHEYLGLTNYEVNNYSITGFLFGFTGNEVELVPTALELDKSFKSMKSYYDLLLNKASNLFLINWEGKLGKKLSASECEDFIDEFIEGTTSGHYSYFCRDRKRFGDIYLSKMTGITQFGLDFDYIFISIYKNTVQGSSRSLYFINSKEKVVQSSDFSVNQYGDIIEQTSAMDDDSNVFTHSVETRKQGQVTKETYVTLGDGSLGTYLYNRKINGRNDETRYSTATSYDWNGFFVSLFPNDISNYGELRGAGRVAQSYAFKYLDQFYSKPDNYRTVIYDHWSRRKPIRGLYVVNRRVYEIR